MGDVRDQLTDLFAVCLASGSPPFDDLAERARAVVLRSLVEECCAGAVVGRLPMKQMRRPGHGKRSWYWEPVRDKHEIPIAAAPASLAPKTARTLAERPSWLSYTLVCGSCGRKLEHATDVECICGTSYTPTERHEELPPYAAAYTDAGGVRTYVLASAACAACGGSGSKPGNLTGYEVRCHCSGTGARTDCKAIADRYPNATGDAHCARFEVPS